MEKETNIKGPISLHLDAERDGWRRSYTRMSMIDVMEKTAANHLIMFDSDTREIVIFESDPMEESLKEIGKIKTRRTPSFTKTLFIRRD